MQLVDNETGYSGPNPTQDGERAIFFAHEQKSASLAVLELVSCLEQLLMKAIMAALDSKKSMATLEFVVAELRVVKEFSRGRGFRSTHNTIRASLMSAQFLRSLQKRQPTSASLAVIERFEVLVPRLMELAAKKDGDLLAWTMDAKAKSSKGARKIAPAAQLRTKN